jgi:hypothetical protein
MFNQEQIDVIKKSHVDYLVPCYGGAVFEKFFVSVLRTMISNNNNGIPFSVDTISNESLVTRARNNLIAKAMSKPDITHFMFIDADVSFEPNDVYKLIAMDKDVACGLYPKKGYPIEYVLNKLNKDDEPDETGHIKVKHAGTGFMLIKREVIEKMFEHYSHLKYRNDLKLDPVFEPYMYALFDTQLSNEGIYLSEDYLFCERWIEMGGEVWVDTTIKLGHSGYHTFQG